MSQTTTSDGSGHRDDAPIRQDRAPELQQAAGSSVSGDAGARLPALPWLAGDLLIIGAAAGLLGAWGLVDGTRRGDHSPGPDRA